VKSNRQTAEYFEVSASGAKALFNKEELTAALKRCATQGHPSVTVCLTFLLAFLLIGFAASAQDKDATRRLCLRLRLRKIKRKIRRRMTRRKRLPRRKRQRRREKARHERRDFCRAEVSLDWAGGASGRVMAIAVNPKNKFEYYVGEASGGVWKTVNDGRRGLRYSIRRRRIRLDG